MMAMSDQATTDNFFQIWSKWDRSEPPPVFFRLYYDDQGDPLFYSMEDLPGNYIEVDQSIYSLNSYDVKVKDGKLVQINKSKRVSKLQPGVESGTCCDTRDVCVVVGLDTTHTKWKKIL